MNLWCELFGDLWKLYNSSTTRIFIIVETKSIIVIVKSYGKNSESEEVYAVVGGVHGDEPMTAEAVKSLMGMIEEDRYEIRKEIRLIVANERALDTGVRYTDTDLNRAFPGDQDSNLYEDRLAHQMYENLNDVDSILSIHSTRSAPPVFAIASDTSSQKNLRTIASMPVDYVVNTRNLRETTMDAQLGNTVTVEAGRQGTEDVKEFGIECSLEFMKSHNVIELDPEYTDKHLIVAERELPKSGGEAIVHYDNFEQVKPGTPIAEDEKTTHMVEDNNKTPILMSRDGYEDIFGLLGRYEGKIESESIE